ncbi:multiple sugar transport system substrate-binding protein [Actinacidiphila yanglinensis]|uniref:Multiple sugar transport system substrate-binding protein n=1 Tax=Actinacidiphila yanglinensis TaxID=310779 RepID=A0A1H5Z4K4_9ACTN|nr:multiple sugar transport system substrate-binding protein [Actinacidiphila yanglinensis]
MQRRRLLGLAAGLTSALALTGVSACGGSSPLSKDVTLHLVAADYGDPKTDNSSLAYWNEMVHDFEQQNPHIKVDVQVLPWTDVDDKVAAMVKAGNPPDIAQMGSYATYAAKGQLYSADQLFTVSEQADFIPSLAQAGSVNRTQYGLPWASSSRMFFYNKSLFKHAGILHAPKTWDDLAADAKLLKDDGVKVPYGLPLGTEESQAESLMWMLGADGGITDSVGNYTFDSTENIDAFTWLKKNLVDAKLVGSKDPATTDRQVIFNDFLSGDAAMINGHPTLLAQARAHGIDVGVAPLPGKDGTDPNTLGVADWAMAFKQNGNLDADRKLLQFVYQTKNTVKFLDEYGLLPVTTSASQVMQGEKRDADLVQFLNLLPDAVFYPVDKTSWTAVSDRMKKVIGSAVHDDPKTVLSQLQNYAENQDGEGLTSVPQ